VPVLDHYTSVAEVAEVLGVHPRTLKSCGEMVDYPQRRSTTHGSSRTILSIHLQKSMKDEGGSPSVRTWKWL
jgi:hypothetical protein